MANEPVLSRGRVPAGYAFVPKGNVYITGTCRRQTQVAKQPVYLVVNSKDKQLGIAVPTAIHKDVQRKEVETRAARAGNVDRRDASIKNVFEQVIMKEFPHLPRAELARVLTMSLAKGAGKVGRTGQLEDRKKAQLAVRAHIRHCHTDYDKLLKGSQRGRGGSKAKRDARRAVQSQIDALAATWKSGRAPQSPLRSGSVKTASQVSSKNKMTTTASKASTDQLPLPSAPATRTATRSVHTGKLQVSRVLEAPTQPRRRIEVIDLTMDDDESPGLKTSVETTLRLIRAAERDFDTLEALQQTKDMWAPTTFSDMPKDPMAVANSDEWGSQRADGLWVSIQDCAMEINNALNEVVGFHPLSPGQRSAEFMREVRQLRMAVVGSGRIAEDKRRVSTDAGRRLSQYFSGMSIFERELS